MKTVVKFLGLVIVVITILTTSCRKQDREEDSETTSAAENFMATNFTNDMANIADEAAKTKNVSSFKDAQQASILSSCTTLQFDTLNNADADSIKVNFGTTNCICNDGRARRGSLLIIYNGKYKDSLATITIKPIGYFVNNNGISGSKTIKNLGRNSHGNIVYQFNAAVVITKANNGGTINWACNRQREWTNGQSTLAWIDDKYSITGTASGSNSNGRSFTSNITKPLIRDMALACRKHFTSGTIEHTPSGKPTRTIDFGNGACDGKATVTINGKAYVIDLN